MLPEGKLAALAPAHSRYTVYVATLLLLGAASLFSLSDNPSPNLQKKGDFLPRELRTYAERVASLVDHDEPLRLAREAYKATGAFPVSFSISETHWNYPAPQSIEDALKPDKLGALNASKTREWAHLIPGDQKTYIFSVEAEYYKAYAESWKAWTWKKGGFDCNRHVEIMATGAIPVFNDSRSIPKYTMFAYPKRLFEFIDDNRNERDPAKLAILRYHLLKWGHSFFTSRAMVRYAAKATHLYSELFRRGSTARVLFLDDKLPGFADYLSQDTLIGLIESFGLARVDVMYLPLYLFADQPARTSSGASMYGKGFSYQNVLPALGSRKLPTQEQILRRLRKARYSLVVYGSYRRNKPFFNETLEAYAGSPNRIWLMDGEDTYNGWAKRDPVNRNATIFVRELYTNDTRETNGGFLSYLRGFGY